MVKRPRVRGPVPWWEVTVTPKAPCGGTPIRFIAGPSELLGRVCSSLFLGELEVARKRPLDKSGVAVMCVKFKRPRKDQDIQQKWLVRTTSGWDA